MIHKHLNKIRELEAFKQAYGCNIDLYQRFRLGLYHKPFNSPDDQDKAFKESFTETHLELEYKIAEVCRGTGIGQKTLR